MKPQDYTRLTQPLHARAGLTLEEKENKWLYKDLTREIINAAIEVHKEIGAGFLEYVYEESLCHELKLRGISFKRQAELDIYYKDLLIPKKYTPDLIVEDKIIVELKASSDLTKNDEAILINYLKASKLRIGLLLNFGTPSLQISRKIY